MKKHSKAFFVSLLVHLMLLGFFVYLYTNYKKFTNPPLQTSQTKLLIHLNRCVEKDPPPQPQIKKISPSVQKFVEKKVEKKVKKKVHKKLKKKLHKVHKEVPKKVVVKKQVIEKQCKTKEKPHKVVHKLPPEKTQQLFTQKVAQPVVQNLQKTPQMDQNPQKRVISKPQPKSAKTSYLQENQFQIQNLLQENLYYPRRARKRGIEGEVVVHFHLNTQAIVSDIKILHSPSEILSRGAQRTLEDLSGVFPKPTEDLDIKVPIIYKLYE
jgi:protein TonB